MIIVSESVLLIEDGKWEDWSAGARRNGFYCMCHVNPHGVHKATFKKLKIIKSQLVSAELYQGGKAG